MRSHDNSASRETVQRYHRLSKHSPRAYAPGPGRLDWATQPDPFRRYRGAQTLALPLLADALPTPWSTLRGAGAVTPRALDGEGIALLLEISLGLSAWKEYGGTRWALRCNPSSGNLHPTEAYVICPRLPGLARGVYHYLSAEHLLERRAQPAEDAVWDARFAGGVLIALSSLHWREAWKYGVRAYRYCQHDAGHAIAALRYAAAALGWRAQLLDDWADAEIAALCGLDRDADFPRAEEREHPDCLLWLGPRAAPPATAPLLSLLANAQWRGTANVLSVAHRDWPDIAAVASAAAKPRTAAAPSRAAAVLPALPASASDMRAADLFRRRRSAVAFDGQTGMSRAAFFNLLDALLPRAGVAPWDAWSWRPRLHPVFFVHRVEGLTPGIYALPRRPAAEATLRAAMRNDWRWSPVGACPAHLPLRLLVEFDGRETAQRISCHQEIAADSSFSLVMLAEYQDALAQGPWVYRSLFWEAGMLGQVLYLEAEAAGLRGTGIGCFFDDELHRLLGLGDERFQSLYHFTVGGAVDDVRLRGLAPYAHLAPRTALR